MKTPPKYRPAAAGWALGSDRVEAFLTRTGGQLGPVSFRLGRREIQPFSVAPWQTEPLPGQPEMLRILRGDFFCAPFGGNAAPFRGERHPAHGETANRPWTLVGRARKGGGACLHAAMETRVRRGRVDKRIVLLPGHTAVYCENVLSGFSGPMCLGTHPMLRFPDREGAGLVSVSGFVRGHVAPPPWERAEEGGYHALRLGAEFTSLKRVPSRDGGVADLSRYPARRGFEDLVMLVGDGKGAFAWSAVAFPGERYVFFSLKDPRILRHTVLWLSNGGRHYPPWNGRHVNVLGLEEVTSFFHLGLADSAGPNVVNRAGFPTAAVLDPARPTRVAHILAVAAIPAGFGAVAAITRAPGGVTLRSREGLRVFAPLDLDFITRPSPASP
jgi:hypothetical protein